MLVIPAWSAFGFAAVFVLWVAFVESKYGSVFEEYRDYYAESCRKDGKEFFQIRQGADSEGDYGTMNYVYACLSRNENLQMIGRSETLFLLDGGYGIGYTEIIPLLLSYNEGLQIVRETEQTF